MERMVQDHISQGYCQSQIINRSAEIKLGMKSAVSLVSPNSKKILSIVF